MKIITAITNEILNERIKELKQHEVLCKDIQYQEALLEILEKNKNINLLILSNILPGELEFCELINVIKYKNDKIKLFIILDEQKEETVKFLIKKDITNIFVNNKITINEIIQKISKQNENIIKIENSHIKDKCKEKFKKFKDMLISGILHKKKQRKQREISIIGATKVGKTVIMILLSLQFVNEKILLINFESNNLNVIFGKKNNQKIQKYNKNIDFVNINNYEEIIKIERNKYDYIFFEIEDIDNKNKIIEKSDDIILIVEPNLIGIKETKIILEKVINKYKIKKEKIKIIYNKKNIFSIKQCILNQMFEGFKNIGSIKSNNYYTYLINKNFMIQNEKIRKEYKKIIKKWSEK